jgi:hypothetical protein
MSLSARQGDIERYFIESLVDGPAGAGREFLTEDRDPRSDVGRAVRGHHRELDFGAVARSDHDGHSHRHRRRVAGLDAVAFARSRFPDGTIRAPARRGAQRGCTGALHPGWQSTSTCRTRLDTRLRWATMRWRRNTSSNPCGSVATAGNLSEAQQWLGRLPPAKLAEDVALRLTRAWILAFLRSRRGVATDRAEKS